MDDQPFDFTDEQSEQAARAAMGLLIAAADKDNEATLLLAGDLVTDADPRLGPMILARLAVKCMREQLDHPDLELRELLQLAAAGIQSDAGPLQ